MHNNLSNELVRRVQADPNYIELETKRNSFGWSLSILMLVIYYGYVLMLAFAKPFLGTIVSGVVTLAFPIGMFVLLSAIVITGIYVNRANSEFDALTRKVVEANR
ncbi:MAG: DUF485 domain-containing protein [Acetobacteraceae bacterium]|nr:DUF485 domain-containing protein [Acetobacteraceae bacterium]